MFDSVSVQFDSFGYFLEFLVFVPASGLATIPNMHYNSISIVERALPVICIDDPGNLPWKFTFICAKLFEGGF